MHFHARWLVHSLALPVSLIALIAPAARAIDVLELHVPHVDYNSYPLEFLSSAAISALMTLQSLCLPETVTLQHIFDYGRSLNPTFTPPQGGVMAALDPYFISGTTILGLWIDDPQFVSIEDNTAVFYISDPQYAGEPAFLGNYFVPMTVSPHAGEYVAVVPVPEPATLGLLGLGGMALLGRRRAQATD